MADLSLTAVKRAVYSWSLRFRETIYDNEQLALLSREYHEDLTEEQVTEKQFAWAAKRTGRSCHFFPKMVDVLEAVQEYRRNPPQDNLEIPETTSFHDPTPAELEMNKKRLAICQDAVCGKISWADATRKMSALSGWAEVS